MSAIPVGPKKMRFSRLDPLALLDIGYNIHAASDETLKKFDNREWQIANKAAELFLRINADPNTPSGEYLLRITALVNSYARATTRAKQDYFKVVQDAIKEFNRAYGRLREGHINAFVIKMVWRLGSSAIVAIIFGLMALVAAPLVPSKMAEVTDKNIITFLVAAFFGGLTWTASFLMDDMRRTRMLAALRETEKVARQDYVKEKLRQQDIHWRLLKEAWFVYTGTRFKVRRPPQEMQMREDLVTTQHLFDMLTEQSLSPATYAIRECYRWSTRQWVRFKNRKISVASAE